MKNRAAQVLRIWGELGARLGMAHRLPVKWDAVFRLIEVARGVFAVEAEQLRTLLAQSSQRLNPLDDPLTVDLGLHRWLAGDREEAYSDWLQWVVEQVKKPELVFRLFALLVPEDHADWPPAAFSVEREVDIPWGHPGHKGRLDLVIRFGEKALIVIEVKKGDADKADKDKHNGYRKWRDKQGQQSRKAILLATAGEDGEDEDGFQFQSWAAVCVELRRMTPLLGKENPLTVAMILAFVGAVEQNLLGFSSSLVRRIRDGHDIPFNPSILNHLDRALK